MQAAIIMNYMDDCGQSMNDTTGHWANSRINIQNISNKFPRNFEATGCIHFFMTFIALEPCDCALKAVAKDLQFMQPTIWNAVEIHEWIPFGSMHE